MASIRQLFAPGGAKFYKLFNDMAVTLKDMSNIFLQSVHDNDLHILGSHVMHLEKLEQANELATHKLLIELGKNFITPFDREDIHALATALNGIADILWKLCKQVQTYNIGEADRRIQRIADCHYRFIKQLASVVGELKNKRELAKLSAKCTELSALLVKCEDLLSEATTALFRADTTAHLVIKKMDQYDTLQGLLNKSSDAVNTIETMIIKYS